MPRFSIVTITKNNAEGLNRTEVSVKTQGFTDYEWVVIDGDKEPDNGIYDAMNKGIERSRGDYILFMNAGDIFADRHTLSLIATHDADFIYGDRIEDGRIIPAKAAHRIGEGMMTSHQAMVYKADILKTLRYDERYSLAADYKLTCEFLRLAHSVAYISKPLCVFEAGGVSQRYAALFRQQEREIRKKLNIKAPLTPLRQWAALRLRQFFPSVYFWLKRL